MDRYRNFPELKQHTTEGLDFIIEVRKGHSGYAIMAPHGGGIEPGTAAAAAAIAGADHAYYAFKGIRAEQNIQLHLASHRFDEPRALALAGICHTIITLHGCRASKPLIYVGGRDEALKHAVIQRLSDCGMPAGEAVKSSLRGLHYANLCNRGTRGKGLQLELSDPLRRQLAGPDGWCTAGMPPQMRRFSEAIRQTLDDHIKGTQIL